VKDIKINVYAIKVVALWEGNSDIQFIHDPYTIANYCTSYFIKTNKTITKKFQTIIKKCENENVDAN